MRQFLVLLASSEADSTESIRGSENDINRNHSNYSF